MSNLHPLTASLALLIACVPTQLSSCELFKITLIADIAFYSKFHPFKPIKCSFLPSFLLTRLFYLPSITVESRPRYKSSRAQVHT